jgi:hypothetical protein
MHEIGHKALHELNGSLSTTFYLEITSSSSMKETLPFDLLLLKEDDGVIRFTARIANLK